ncbi:MAG: TetR/AcrR family transcriptional regulator [Flavobacteriales bacterium]|nr:TetR/AcrR family transcriptional regulator [Flavobacteriales bacterium]
MRPKEFNRNNVLEKCIILFWEEGYNGTGIQEIVDRTNVNRYSLYDEFGNKKGILLASLKLYRNRHINWELLSQSLSIEELLFKFYTSFFNSSKYNNHPIGCYISSMAMELRETNEMQSYFNMYLDLLNDRFEQLLKEKSTLSIDKIKIISQQLTTFYCTSMGMYVIFSQKEAESYIQSNLKLITKCLNK